MEFPVIETAVAILAFLAVVLIGFSVILYRSHKKKSIEVRMVGVFEDDPFSEKTEQTGGILKFLEKVGNIASHSRASASLWEQMIQAGFLHPFAPAIYTGAKILLFIIGFLLSTILVIPSEMIFSSKMTMIFLGATVSFFLPNLFLLYQMKKRHDEIYRHLPEAVDLLEICVSSGLGLDMAWNIVAEL